MRVLLSILIAVFILSSCEKEDEAPVNIVTDITITGDSIVLLDSVATKLNIHFNCMEAWEVKEVSSAQGQWYYSYNSPLYDTKYTSDDENVNFWFTLYPLSGTVGSRSVVAVVCDANTQECPRELCFKLHCGGKVANVTIRQRGHLPLATDVMIARDTIIERDSAVFKQNFRFTDQGEWSVTDVSEVPADWYSFSATSGNVTDKKFLVVTCKETPWVVSRKMTFKLKHGTKESLVTIVQKGKAVKHLYYPLNEWTTRKQWAILFEETKDWQSANPLNELIQHYKIDSLKGKLFPIVSVNGQVGKAASLTTLNTVGQKPYQAGKAPVPMITPGLFFLGTSWGSDEGSGDHRKNMKFGIPSNVKPLTVSGYYKYIPGKKYYTCSDPLLCHNDGITGVIEDPTVSDQFVIMAILYEVSSMDNSQILDGKTILTSDRIVASAELSGGEVADFTPFELILSYKKVFDATKNYRFTIICSASKDWNSFSGAPGSNLVVDEIRVVNSDGK